MCDAVGAFERLMQSVATAEKLRTLPNDELAALLMEHVYADLEMTSPQADLVSEVMDRLRGLKTCAVCHGWGYVAHARCAGCDGTGDAAPGGRS